jgi:hypothetical protein
MGGKEAAAIIRQQNALVPIIFLTGEIAVSMKECVKTFAPAYLLLKPSNKRTLVAVSVQLVIFLCMIHLCSKFESRIDLVASSNTHSVHSSNALSNISASTTASARAWVRSAMLNATQCVWHLCVPLFCCFLSVLNRHAHACCVLALRAIPQLPMKQLLLNAYAAL